MSQVFGSRVLPPPSVLPGKVSDAVEAWRSAQERTTQATAKLAQHKRDALPAARRADVEAHAQAIEEGKTPPKRGAHEERALSKLVELERAAEASQLVEQRAYIRMNEAIEQHAGAIAHAAEKRLSAAREKYLGAVAALEEAGEELRLGYALRNWASEPASSWKVRALRGVPIPRHSSDAPDFGSVVSALREVVEAPRRPRMPSPFGTAPVEEPEVEPAPAGPAA